MEGKYFFNCNKLTKRNFRGDILWVVDMDAPDWYKTVESFETADIETHFEINQNGFTIFKWGNYRFSFPVDKDGIVTEVLMSKPDIDYIPPAPILRVGLILEDPEGELYEVAFLEHLRLPPSKVKGCSRFSPPDGLYSPYGWECFRYTLKKVGTE